MEFCDVGHDVLVKYLVVLQPSIKFNYTKHYTTHSFPPIVHNHTVGDNITISAHLFNLILVNNMYVTKLKETMRIQ